jgi:hypothetical protein
VGFLERFWRRVDDRGGPSACWPWRGWINDGGYGVVALGGKTSRAIHIRAHRLAYELVHRQPIPPELTIDHLCRVRHCVNPAHLDVVTKGVNVLRGETTAARHARVMACPQGHSYDEVNTEWKADGSRACRICRRRRCREWWRQNRAHAPPRQPRRRVLDGPPRGGPTDGAG